MTPDVSVILPAYNSSAYLSDAISALLKQSHPSLEIVVVDDGSTDGTLAIAKASAARDPRVTVVALSPNGGVANARRAAVAASSGTYLWFVDADDRWPATALDSLLTTALRTGADVVVAGANYLMPDGTTKTVGRAFDDGQLSTEAAFRLFLRGEITGHLWNKLFRSSLAGQIEFTPAKVHSDQAMVAQFIAAAGSVATSGALVYHYVLRTGSIIRSGTPRAESLDLVNQTVTAAARRVDASLPSTDDFAYYQLRFFALSAMKDATSGAYAPADARRRVTVARRRISTRGIRAVVAGRESKRLALALAAKFSTPLYKLALSRGGGRI